MLKTFKRISDPVHGTIELTEVEERIVSSRAFQRLHNVRQLGLAHYVFPGANYSRFAHSVGACHNAQRLLHAIKKNAKGSNYIDNLPEHTEQAIRLAALTHDIGHYPFSHAFEHEIEDAYAGGLLGEASLNGTATTMDHEEMGAEVLASDSEISKILKEAGYVVDDIEDQFNKDRSKLARILDSDLDCDRLDYLRRTAHHSGLPYGNVDINYLIDQATVDAEDRFCFGGKALRAVDHLLISRYYDYLQVPFHKSVVALEWSLRVVIRELLRKSMIECSAESMRRQVVSEAWRSFDDNYVLALARDLLRGIEREHGRSQYADGVRHHLQAILHRQPAKVVASYEAVGSETDVRRHYSEIRAAVEKEIAEFIKRHGLCQLAMHLWQPKPFSIIKASTAVNGYTLGYRFSEEEPESQNYVRVQDGSLSEPIFRFKQALMHSVYNCKYWALRIYAMPSEDRRFFDLLKEELQPKIGEVGFRLAVMR